MYSILEVAALHIIGMRRHKTRKRLWYTANERDELCLRMACPFGGDFVKQVIKHGKGNVHD